MAANVFPSRTIGELASATGGVALIGVTSISLFYIFGGFFGGLNDVCNAVQAVLSALLAWQLYPWHRSQSPRLSRFALIAAWLGALIAVIGSALVLFRDRGWYLPGLYTTFGYALIGAWLAGVNQAARLSLAWPRRLTEVGRVTGAFMAAGFLAGPGILRGMESMGAAPWWVNLGFLSGLGWLLLYPVWCLWLGRLAAHGETRPEAAQS